MQWLLLRGASVSVFSVLSIIPAIRKKKNCPVGINTFQLTECAIKVQPPLSKIQTKIENIHPSRYPSGLLRGHYHLLKSKSTISLQQMQSFSFLCNFSLMN